MLAGCDFSAERALWLSRNILPHEPALRAQLSRWRLPDGLDAGDVVQECYAKFAMMDAVAEIRSPKAYLFQIARSIILMHLRRSRIVSIQAVERIDALGVSADEPLPDEQVSDRQQLHLLAGMIAALPSPAREAMNMRLVQELSHREIGERLGMTANAVQKTLAKCLASFAAQLGRGGFDDVEASRGNKQVETKPGNAEARNQHGD